MTQKINIPKLETTRLILRAINLNDAASVFTYGQDEEIIKYLFWNKHTSIDDSIRFVKSVIQNYQSKNQIMWAIELKSNSEMIGTCGYMNYFPNNKTIEIGYAINRNYWKKGYTKEALQAIINYTFNNLDIIRIQGICVDKNLASAKTMMSCNMEFEGILHDSFIKNNRIHNCKMFAITKRNYLKNKPF